MSFWDVHGIVFVIFMFFFPRLTMLFSRICFMPFAGILFWIGWALAPRLTVAILATTFYWHTNPILVVLTWFWALGGEGTEKGASKKAWSRRQERLVS
jgi:hypothetical protein